jgi:voltage-gated potassium channel
VLQKWIDHSNIPLAVLGVIYLAFYTMQVIVAEDTSAVRLLETASWVIWAIFATDLIVRMLVAPSITSFLKSSWLEVLAVAVPFLRVLRLFRIVVTVRGLKPLMKNRMTATGTYIMLVLPLVWFVGAIGVLDAERSAESPSIASLQDALWWSLVTITTVGYGDLSPNTLEGKFVAAILMISGIALFSAGAGIFASWIMKGKPEESK